MDQLMYTCIIKALNKTLWLINALLARRCFLQYRLHSPHIIQLQVKQLFLDLNYSFLLSNAVLNLHCVYLSYTNIFQILRSLFHMPVLRSAIQKPLATSFILWLHYIHLVTCKIVGYKNSLAVKAEYWWWFYTAGLILPFSKLFNCKSNCLVF